MLNSLRKSNALAAVTLDTVLRAGAGLCKELDTYIEHGAKRIILMEPNPQLAEMLKLRTRSHPQVQMLTEALGAEAGAPPR